MVEQGQAKWKRIPSSDHRIGYKNAYHIYCKVIPLADKGEIRRCVWGLKTAMSEVPNSLCGVGSQREIQESRRFIESPRESNPAEMISA
jgi:hypothetical protein